MYMVTFSQINCYRLTFYKHTTTLNHQFIFGCKIMRLLHRRSVNVLIALLSRKIVYAFYRVSRKRKSVLDYYIQVLMAFSREGEKAIYIMFPCDIFIISSITSRNNVLHSISLLPFNVVLWEVTVSLMVLTLFQLQVSFYKETSVIQF